MKTIIRNFTSIFRKFVAASLLNLLGFSPFVVGFYRLLLVHTS